MPGTEQRRPPTPALVGLVSKAPWSHAVGDEGQEACVFHGDPPHSLLLLESRAQRPQSSGPFPSHIDPREAELAVLRWGLNPPTLHGERAACRVLATQTYTLGVLPPQFKTHPPRPEPGSAGTGPFPPLLPSSQPFIDPPCCPKKGP